MVTVYLYQMVSEHFELFHEKFGVMMSQVQRIPFPWPPLWRDGQIWCA
jgi:hypothetical protein